VVELIKHLQPLKEVAMKRIIKCLLILGSILIIAALAVILIVPILVDDQKYRSMIENQLSEAVGSPVKLDGDLRLSLFPWASIAVSDIHLENPPGFTEKDFISAESFNVQVKLVPLILSLLKDFQVKRFTLKGARIVLETRNDGRANWEELGKTSTEISRGPKKGDEKQSNSEPGELFPIEAIDIGEFAVTGGSLIYIDHTKGERLEISDLSLLLKDFSLDRPIHIVFSAQVDGRPLSIEGKVGPLGRDLGKGVIPVDLSLEALKQVQVRLKGSITDAASNLRFDMSIEALPFSPRKITAAMGREFPVVTSDPEALTRLAFTADFNGDTGNASVSEGVIQLDKSTVNFFGKISDFSKPDVTFDLKLDEVDLDRYLAAETDVESDAGSAEAESVGQKNERIEGSASLQKTVDYEPLRRLALNGRVQVAKLKAANARIQDLSLKISGKNGVFNLEPLNFNLYQGNVSANGFFSVKKDIPETSFRLKIEGIHAGPLLNDIAHKDILEGILDSGMALQMKGVDAERIIKSLNGKGNFSIKNGAIKGIDLVSMVRNTDGAYGFGRKSHEKPKTEFNELQAPFTIKDGVFYSDNTRMVSTLIRVQSKGKVDLVGEALDFRIEPTFVTTGKEDVEKMKSSEIMFPVLVTGNISDPKFRPDLRGISEKKLEEEIFESSRFKELFEKEELKPFEKDAKNLLKGILGVPKALKEEQ